MLGRRTFERVVAGGEVGGGLVGGSVRGGLVRFDGFGFVVIGFTVSLIVSSGKTLKANYKVK